MTCYAVLEVVAHEKTVTNGRSISVALTQMEFTSAVARKNFGDNLIKEEDLGYVIVYRKMMLL